MTDEAHAAEHRQTVLKALEQLVMANMRALDKGVGEGALHEDARVDCLTGNMLRAIDRIADLSVDEDLTPDETQMLQANLWQVCTNALSLLIELPFEGMHVIVAAFDTSKPQ